MDVCQETQTSDGGKAVCAPVQLISPPPPAAASSNMSQPGNSSQDSTNSIHGSTPVLSPPGQHTHPSHDIKRFQKSFAGPSTSCSRSQTCNRNCILPPVKRKLAHDEDSDCCERSGHEKRVRKR